jgi:hypothetical protein
VRTLYNDGHAESHLLCSKNRVAPLKAITIPRLELSAALLLAQLMSKIKKTLNIPAEKFIYWSDSTIVLSWLKMPSSSLKTFVANRVGEIQSLTSVEDWYHIRTFENPADILSRGVTPQQLNDSMLWWHGPQFLRFLKVPMTIFQFLCLTSLKSNRNAVWLPPELIRILQP